MNEERQFVRVLIRNDEGKYLVVSKRYGSKVLWNFPGGKVESFETPVNAAAREIEEEIGLALANIELIWKDILRIDKKIWMGYYYTANVDKMAPVNREKGLIRSFKFKDIIELDKSPSIKATLVDVAALIEREGGSVSILPKRLRQMVLPLWHTEK